MREELYEIYAIAESLKVNPESFNKDTTREELFGYVLRQIKFNIRVNETFQIKDLFKGYIWKRLSQGQKAELGRLITDYINDYIGHDYVKGFCYNGKTKQNQIIYKRTNNIDECGRPVPRKIRGLTKKHYKALSLRF